MPGCLHRSSQHLARIVVAHAQIPRLHGGPPYWIGASARKFREDSVFRHLCRRSAIRRKPSRGQRPRRDQEVHQGRWQMAHGQPGTQSRPKYPPRPSRHPTASRKLPSPGHVASAWLHATKRAQPFVGGVPNERFKAKPNRLCVGAGKARNLGMPRGSSACHTWAMPCVASSRSAMVCSAHVSQIAGIFHPSAVARLHQLWFGDWPDGFRRRRVHKPAGAAFVLRYRPTVVPRADGVSVVQQRFGPLGT